MFAHYGRTRINKIRWNRQCFRTYQQYQQHIELPQVKYLRPVAWSATAITFIYFGAAYWEVTSELKRAEFPPRTNTRHKNQIPTFEQIELQRRNRVEAAFARRSDTDFSPYDLASIRGIEAIWNLSLPIEKATWSVTGLNTSIYLAFKLVPSVAPLFYHLPIANNNWTLLTSMFGHSGPFHLFANMFVLNNFAEPTSRSRTFQSSIPHCVAFYLSSGILSCLGYHLQSAVKPLYRITPCLGASGAIYAMIGVFSTSFPNAELGIIFLPFTFSALNALYATAAFELYGTLFGTGLGIAHVAHLSGLAAGVAYVYEDSGKRVWQTLKGAIYYTSTGQRPAPYQDEER